MQNVKDTFPRLENQSEELCKECHCIFDISFQYYARDKHSEVIRVKLLHIMHFHIFCLMLRFILEKYFIAFIIKYIKYSAPRFMTWFSSKIINQLQFKDDHFQPNIG